MRTLKVMMLAVLLAGCASKPVTDEQHQCSEGLDAVNTEFNQAQADGFYDNLTLIKASALISAALVQKEFGKYTACLDKIERARAYIADAKKR
jgi:hypothetical protein